MYGCVHILRGYNCRLPDAWCKVKLFILFPALFHVVARQTKTQSYASLELLSACRPTTNGTCKVYCTSASFGHHDQKKVHTDGLVHAPHFLCIFGIALGLSARKMELERSTVRASSSGILTRKRSAMTNYCTRNTLQGLLSIYANISIMKNLIF